MSLQRIPLELIDPSPFQMRQEMDAESLQALAQSLDHDGQQRPVQARPVGERYQLAYGHRTTEAARLLGWEDILAMVKPMTDEEMEWSIYAENRFNRDWNDYDYALWLNHMMEKYKFNQKEMAEKANMSRSRVAQLLRMLQLKEDVTAVTLSKLTERHTREILSKPVVDRAELGEKVSEYVEEKGETPSPREISKMHDHITHEKALAETGVSQEEYDRMEKQQNKNVKAEKERVMLVSYYGNGAIDDVFRRMKVTGFDTRKKYMQRYVMRLHEQASEELKRDIIGRLEY